MFSIYSSNFFNKCSKILIEIHECKFLYVKTRGYPRNSAVKSMLLIILHPILFPMLLRTQLLRLLPIRLLSLLSAILPTLIL